MSTASVLPLARAQEDAEFNPATIAFGTDGWRAIIHEDFNAENLARVAATAAQIFWEDYQAGKNTPSYQAGAGALTHQTEQADPLNRQVEGAPSAGDRISDSSQPIIMIGYDCRENAGRYALLAGALLARAGFKVQVSHQYCPTPTLCWSVAQNPQAIGGFILTSSHNPAEYLGVKLRMADGGASPKHFTNRVEAALTRELPTCFAEALALAEQAEQLGQTHLAEQAGGAVALRQANQTEQAEAPTSRAMVPTALTLELTDLMTPYLTMLASQVDASAIAAAGLRVVVDPLFGAGRLYLAQTLRSLGVEVVEVNNADDPTFAGLHPEPILPWIQGGLDTVRNLGFDACFIVDGDADRIGAGTTSGSFVNPHKILALVTALLVEDKGQRGRVVRTLSGSNLIKRQCERLGLPLTTTPIGFKWIYEEMLAGDVLIGGEESGGIGIPAHVRERDGLLMALLLTELMAKTGKPLGSLVNELLDTLGYLEYARRDLRLTPEVKAAFLRSVCEPQLPVAAYAKRFLPLGEELTQVDYRDGVRFDFASGAWLLARPSGTEPLVRVYAEADTLLQVEHLLDAGCALVQGA